MRIQGTLLSVDQKSGTFTDQSGQERAYDNVTLLVFDPSAKAAVKVVARGEQRAEALALASRTSEHIELDVRCPEQVSFVGVPSSVPAARHAAPSQG